MAQVFALGGKTMVPIKVFGNQSNPTWPRDRLQLFWNAPLAPGHGPKSGPESKQNVFYADAWKIEIARRMFGSVADFPELVW